MLFPHKTISCAVVTMLAACSSKPTDRGQQYKDGKFTQPFSLVNQPDAVGAPINAGDFAEQINHIRNASPRLYGNQSSVYNAVQEWLRAGGDTRNLRQFGIDAWQMEGADNYGNVQFTGYYTPVIQARHTRQGEFQYPIYRMPPKRGRLPSRAEIYAGALSDKYILAYSNSLMDNFIMDVQGYDDIELASFMTPPLTTIHQPKDELGELAIDVLIHRMAQPTLQQQRLQLTPVLMAIFRRLRVGITDIRRQSVSEIAFTRDTLKAPVDRNTHRFHLLTVDVQRLQTARNDCHRADKTTLAGDSDLIQRNIGSGIN